MKPILACVVIPTCNHTTALDAILTRLEAEKLPVIVVDDGSTPENGERIRSICANHPGAEWHRHAFNGGKGFAVMCGIARAAERGFSHAVQVDADGQHDLGALGALLAMAARNPNAIVTGQPQYDASAPASRRFGRKLTTFWMHVNTLSLRLPDGMCGFRVYPVQATLDLVRKSVSSRRMQFDTEVMVKAHWAGMAVASVPVAVIYPEGNLSNFQMVTDNVQLSAMHARLFFTMLLRIPSLLFRKPPKIVGGEPTRWSKMAERGAGWGLHFLAAVYRILGRGVCLAVMTPVIFYFFATGREQREASRDFLARVWRAGHLQRKPTLWTSFRHFLAFGGSALDKFSAWTGGISNARLQGPGVAALNGLVAQKQGAFIITAHLGNPDVVRAIGVLGNAVPLNVLVHTENAQLFNRLINQFSPQAPVRAIPVTKVGADTAILLSDAIARGEWVVMVGDRVPVNDGGRIVEAPFFGELAPFPQGPYVLASILKAPVYLLFCARERGAFKVHFEKFADRIDLPRRDREGAIRVYAERYAKALEGEAAAHPLQWFNFFSFWHQRGASSAGSLQR